MKKKLNRSVTTTAFIVSVILFSCSDNKEAPPSNAKKENKIFNTLSSSESGITFNNRLEEDSVINYFTYPYLYMGGGIAAGDFNNDGLQDLYFTGNMVENKLYLNKGDLKFEDVTDAAGVAGDDRWMTGCTIVDINADGWLDIYVSVSGKFAATKNLMYVNQGESEDGVPRFIEMAEELGIADEGHSTQGTFFDYDKDGDLDLYVANYPPTGFKTPNVVYQSRMQIKDPNDSDKLYENKGNGTFEDVSKEAGILNFGLGLSATVGDFNKDGWEDIYVSNDFALPDFFYFNNGDGTFSERLRKTTQHTSFFGMGADVADFNNDGLLDIIQLDMTPEDNFRNKANLTSITPAGFYEMVNLGFHYQYMQNTLQMNIGIAEDGLPRFSEVARITGVSSTDWSWAPLFADFDNDGLKDLFVTNGTRKDINNKDYFDDIDKATLAERKKLNHLKLSKEMPEEPIPNYAFKNYGDLTFKNVAADWGVDFTGYSNGAAYADLDNDGDLDLVVNNIDDVAVIHENLTADKGEGNYLRIKLSGIDRNTLGLGTKVELKGKHAFQYQELAVTRGFQSSVEPFIHFGLGKSNIVEELIVTWNDGKQQILKDIEANQLLEINYEDSESINEPVLRASKPFVDKTEELQIDYLHMENPYNDFEYEVMLPHIYSKNGPGLAIGDVNGDGLEDFFVGGATKFSGKIYLQQADGSFTKSQAYQANEDIKKEDMGAAFLDADGDGDLDLYIVSGGNEHQEGSPMLQDRLYINDGKGNFTKATDALPEVTGSGSRVKVADYDNDGDPDLFVGGRIVPQSYPLPAKSYILRNDTNSGTVKFTDVTKDVAPDLIEAGLVTDAEWVDFDSDGKSDLVVVGEWMPITFFKNTGDKFVNKTEAYGFEKSTGWWYSIIAEDFDDDGDKDLVAGNLGLNYKFKATHNESFDVFAKDFDQNGQLDIVLGYYNDGIQYPVRGRDRSAKQIPAIKVKFPDYTSFAKASLEDVYFAKDLEEALHYQARNFASSYIENKGDGDFVLQSLPNEVQVSSINDIVTGDFNNDGHIDMIVAGNMYGTEVETPRNDASYGKLLYGDGKGNFNPVPYAESGILLKYDTKDLAKINTSSGLVILAANNQDSLRALLYNRNVQETEEDLKASNIENNDNK